MWGSSARFGKGGLDIGSGLVGHFPAILRGAHRHARR